MNLPTLSLVTKPSSSSQGWVLGLFESETETKNNKAEAPLFLGKKDAEISALLQKISAAGHFNGAKDSCNFLRFLGLHGLESTILLGLGKKQELDPERLRRSGAILAKQQKKEKVSLLSINMDSLFKFSPKHIDYAVQAFCEGYLQATYTYRRTHKKTPDFLDFGIEFVTPSKNKGLEMALARAVGLSEAVCYARVLGDRAPNDLYPAQMAKDLEKDFKALGIEVSHWDEKRLEKERCGLLLGVGKGSVHQPRLIFLNYQGAKKSDPHIALIGKAVTFDTGGISLKPPPRMEEMKYDMMGSGTVAGVFYAAAKLKLKVNLKGYIAAAENMPGGNAQKPGDIQTSRSGKTVEITNTDAEGRLCMADAMEVAQEFKPCAMMDFATLTGAVVVALGSCTSGIMGTSHELLDRIEDAAEVTGEKVWELPLYPEYEEFLKSSYADIKNSSDVREAGSSKAGTFLKFFVDKQTPWVHFDIAGSAWARKDAPYHPSEYASGATVRLVAHMLENWKPMKH